jgi:transcriptional regulator with XRE-family HTH domain
MPEKSLVKVVGERVRAIRAKQRINQTDLIGALRDVGFDFEQPTISRIERGERELSVSELFGFAAALGVSPVALVAPDAPSVIEAGGREVDDCGLRDWMRGFVPPSWIRERGAVLAYYEALPEDERAAFHVPGVERLVRWTTDRLLRALGDGDTELAHRLLDDIKRFADTIRDETPTEED